MALAHMGRWTWQGMLGNGWRTGMMRAIIRTHLLKTQPDLSAVLIGCSAAVPGALMRGSCGRRFASGAIRTTRTMTSVFDASPRRTSERGRLLKC